MSKYYIDAEELITILKERKAQRDQWYERYGDTVDCAKAYELSGLIDIVTSIQQEQPMPDSTKLIELWHEDKEMLKEKDFRDDPWRLAYNAFMCGFGRGIAVNKQNHPGVDAVKDLALTWEDVKKILKFARASIADAFPYSLSNEELAKEVLKRFNKRRGR